MRPHGRTLRTVTSSVKFLRFHLCHRCVGRKGRRISPVRRHEVYHNPPFSAEWPASRRALRFPSRQNRLRPRHTTNQLVRHSGFLRGRNDIIAALHRHASDNRDLDRGACRERRDALGAVLPRLCAVHREHAARQHAAFAFGRRGRHPRDAGRARRPHARLPP